MPIKPYKTIDNATKTSRKVKHIGTHVGAKDGESWRLVLECGHVEWRRKDPIRPFQRFARPAPATVHCASCAAGVRWKDLKSAIALAESIADNPHHPEVSIP